MQRTRQVMWVALVATALCAGRVATVAPQQAPATPLAGRLIHRLTRSFRRVVPTARLYQPRREGARTLETFRPSAPEPVFTLPVCFTPFHFRLPPPLA